MSEDETRRTDDNGGADDGEQTGNAPADPAAERVAFLAWVHAVIQRRESPSDAAVWCACWWEHPEAVDRLTSLHKAWIKASEEDALSGWWVYHWDHHWPLLTSRSGPFRNCIDGAHQPSTPEWATVDDPPARWRP